MPDSLLPFVVLAPLAASLVLFVTAGRLPERVAQGMAVGSVGIAALLSLFLAAPILSGTTPALHDRAWSWMQAPGLSAQISFTLDPLSTVMILVVTFVGFLIHLYAAAYMRGDEGFARFFGSMTLFVAFMLILVLSSDLLFLFLGWEGVGLCSYLLIGFWFREPANIAAARKAFIITRIGDTALLCGVLLLVHAVGSLRIDTVLQAATTHMLGTRQITVACLLVAVGAFSKSAQFPFQTWLPDAMAGPTPTSALIHAATMVTAGIYLMARLHVLFAMAPVIMILTACIGTFTLLMAAISALVQTDLKRVLAWSTISQLGYMFLALGAGAWDAALFHLMTHAFFKALLFLSAGAVITRVHHEQDIYRMGGLLTDMPGVGSAFLAGAMALAGLPLITAGFYSKELIFSRVWSSGLPFPQIFWGVAVLGSFLTSLYIFRCFFVVFMGKRHADVTGRTGPLMTVPLACLAVLSLVGGYVDIPDAIAPLHLFTRMLQSTPLVHHVEEPAWLLPVASFAPLLGLALAWGLWGRKARHAAPTSFMICVQRGWGVDALYNWVVLRPFAVLTDLSRRDAFNVLSEGTARLVLSVSTLFLQFRNRTLCFLAESVSVMTHEGNHFLAWAQNGRVRWYAGWMTAGLCAALVVVVLS